MRVSAAKPASQNNFGAAYSKFTEQLQSVGLGQNPSGASHRYPRELAGWVGFYAIETAVGNRCFGRYTPGRPSESRVHSISEICQIQLRHLAPPLQAPGSDPCARYYIVMAAFAANDSHGVGVRFIEPGVRVCRNVQPIF